MRKPGYPFEAQKIYDGEVIIMKKITAALLCVMLVICTSVTAFGATKNDVKEKTQTAVSFAFDGNYSKNGYEVSASKNLYILARSGTDISGFTDDYFRSVSEAAESGTLTDAGIIGMAASIADFAGTDPENAGGVDLVAALKNADLSAISSPYNYFYAIEAAKNNGLDSTVTALCDTLAQYYTPGVGTDFWNGYGTSPDDLAMFILAMETAGAYEEYTEDAFHILETFATPQGYSNYGANADSTALALAAYSAAGNAEKADGIYDILIENFYDAETGGFKADYDEYYATADAVFALGFYLPLAEDDEPQESTTAADETTTVSQQAATAVQNKDTGKTSPYTGVQTAPALCAAAFAVILGSVLIKRKTGASK